MKFELTGRIRFSGDLYRASADVNCILEGARDLLNKGVPKGETGARLSSWRIEGKDIEVEIESGRHVRAHDAILRIAKLLGAELGKRRKIGLRGVVIIEEKVKILGCLDREALVAMTELPFSVKNTQDGVELNFREISESDIRNRVIDRAVASVQAALAKKEKLSTEPKVVRSGGRVTHRHTRDPFEECIERRWIVEFPGRGQWIFSEPYAALIRAIEGLIIERIAGEMGFAEAMLPKLIPLEVMKKMPGYLDSVPEGMYYVCPPPRDPGSFSKFKSHLKLTGKLPVDELEKVLKEPSYVLAPAQCEPFYQAFSGKRVKLEDLPVKMYDRSGWTYRWEGGGVEGLVRTQEFMRIELVFMGSPADVVSIRDEVVERSIKLGEDLGMEWRLLVATPFYLREGETGTGAGKSGVATYDLEAFLPYSKKWLEVGSYNVHRDRFTKSFKIKEVKNREIWTGCCGFGTSRWAVAFLAQHGMEQDSWPSMVRGRTKKLQSGFRVVE